MKNALLGLFLSLFLAAPGWAACTGSCSTDGDCAANACHYCDTGASLCADCCEILDQPTCPPACTWDSGSSECRNEPSTSCGITVPEVPARFRAPYYIGILLVAALAFAWFGRRKFRAPRA